MNIVKSGLGALALSLFVPVAAFAVPVELTVDDSPTFQQMDNSPCVIGNPSCSNPVDFDFTLIPANTESGSLSSPDYTVQQIRDLVGDVFFIAIDLQEPDGDFDLVKFALLIDGVTEFFIDGETLPVVEQGNGFSDHVLIGFDLSTFAADSVARFDLMFADAQGAREQFFLVAAKNGSTEIPEPATAALLLASLAGVASRRRKA